MCYDTSGKRKEKDEWHPPITYGGEGLSLGLPPSRHASCRRTPPPHVGHLHRFPPLFERVEIL
jgi:hypothetical protein